MSASSLKVLFTALILAESGVAASTKKTFFTTCAMSLGSSYGKTSCLDAETIQHFLKYWTQSKRKRSPTCGESGIIPQS